MTEHCHRCGQLHAGMTGPGPHCVADPNDEFSDAVKGISKMHELTSPSAYHRKLAEAIWDASIGVNGGATDVIGSFADALAEKGVVDPEVVKQLQNALSVRDQQLAALRAERFDSSSTTMVETVRQAVAAERERAAKIVITHLVDIEDSLGTIRAEIAAAVRATGDSDAT